MVTAMNERILIMGVPRAGKTFRASEIARTSDASAFHTDGLMDSFEHLPLADRWSAVSNEISLNWLSRPGPWVVEGVAAVRGLRKWLEANPDGLPADRFIFMREPREELTKGQQSMAKGCVTVWEGQKGDRISVVGELRRRGAVIDDFGGKS